MRLLLALLTLSFIAPAHADLVKKTVEYKQGGKTFEGYVVYDDAAKTPQPSVLIAHDWMGLTDKTKDRAEMVAKLGYVAFAVDVYGKGVRPANAEEAGKLATEYKKDRKLLRQRMEAGLKEMRGMKSVDKKRMAVIGYCFGGTAALELARDGADVKDVVTFHGGLDSPTPADGKKIKGKVLALHGADDPYVPAADVNAFEDELRQAGVDYQLVRYGHAVHSFTDKSAGTDNSKGAAYNPVADARSWQAMSDFLKDNL